MLTDAQRTANVCYLETIGRSSGNPHEIEIWFASSDGQTVHMLSGGLERSDWVRNLRVNPECRLRFGTNWFNGTAREVAGTPAELETRRALAARYYGWKSGDLPNDWSRNSLPIAIDLAGR